MTTLPVYGGGQVPRARGRRPAGSNTRETIAAAAARQFAELGYPHTTLRGIAREADVDTRLVTHYFGTKQNLFVSVVEFPLEPSAVVDGLLSEGPGRVGHRLARLVIETLETPSARQTMTGMLRAAASEDDAATLVRGLLTDRLVTPLARMLSGDRPDLRAALIGTQLTGYVFARYVVELPGMTETSAEELATVVGPVLQHYLTGDLGSAPGA
ncbi:TetR family transcriptional regulator [Phycicoccus sp. BSK3Z-2]|uniref:TetR family transcriptional regulator n=1 Tax=Phycicoccus avicenniae TaxID=2828860 RepID=A0A941DAN5_9MICO|nr:TetR family transcriptional regulator [Phycicoccus avicenniae]MBR7743507.1 TetR family transcriptional regulator [Phycicoccus avicenniae]